MNQRK